MVRYRGDLSCNIEDFEFLEVSNYKGKNRDKNPLDDMLIPYIPYKKLDEVATLFLKIFPLRA